MIAYLFIDISINMQIDKHLFFELTCLLLLLTAFGYNAHVLISTRSLLSLF